MNPQNIAHQTKSDIQSSIANKKHLNDLLDKVLLRERLRQGYSATSKENGVNTELEATPVRKKKKKTWELGTQTFPAVVLSPSEHQMLLSPTPQMDSGSEIMKEKIETFV